jgi:methylenetetrahydrofolate dehydrogenase (NAD+)
MEGQVPPAAAPAGPPSCKVVLAKNIATSLMAEVQAGLEKIGTKPLLVGFLANEDPAAEQYAKWSANTCREK